MTNDRSLEQGVSEGTMKVIVIAAVAQNGVIGRTSKACGYGCQTMPYAQWCTACHNTNGSGRVRVNKIAKRTLPTGEEEACRV